MAAWVNRHGVLLWFGLLALLIGAFALRKHGELEAIGRDLARADPRWLLVALACQTGMTLLAVLTYRILLTRLGRRPGFATLAVAHLQRIVAGTLTPVGGPASIYVFARFLQGRGVPAEDAVLTVALRSTASYAAFLLLLAPALALGHPQNYTLFAAAALLALFIVMLTGLRRLIQGNGPLLARWEPARLAAFTRHVRCHGLSVGDLRYPFLLGLASYLAGAAALGACLLAVGARDSLTIALVGYVVGALFTIVAPVFQGIGIVDVSIIVALRGMGVAEGDAIAATLLYRFGDVWLPLAVGLCVEVVRRPRVRALLSFNPARERR